MTAYHCGKMIKNYILKSNMGELSSYKPVQGTEFPVCDTQWKTTKINCHHVVWTKLKTSSALISFSLKT